LIINDELVGVGVLENVIGKLKLEDGQFLIDFFETGFLRVVELGAGPDKILVESFEELALLGIESEAAAVALIIDRLDAGEELRVEIYFIVMLGERRSQVGGDGLKFIVGIGREEIFQEAAGAIKEETAAVKGFDGVSKGGWIGVFGNGFNFFIVAIDTFEDGRFEMLVFDAVERRSLKRRSPSRKERVVGSGGR